jgi:hypothetical protein
MIKGLHKELTNPHQYAAKPNPCGMLVLCLTTTAKAMKVQNGAQQTKNAISAIKNVTPTLIWDLKAA